MGLGSRSRTFSIASISIAIACCSTTTFAGGETKDGQRNLRVDDVFSVEEISDFAAAPNDNAAAFMILRPANSQLANGLAISEARSDIWVQLAAGQPAKNVTNGKADASGWWQPQWSPDGRRLSMLSSRGGNVTAWVWERESDTLRQLSPSGMNFLTAHPGCDWLSNERLLCLAVPEGRLSPPDTLPGHSVALARAAWERSARGEKTDSAVDSVSFPRVSARLVLIDSRTKRESTVASDVDQGAYAESWWVSPSAAAVAYARATPADFPGEDQAKLGNPSSLAVAALSGQAISLSRHLPVNVIATSVSWSPRGDELAFFAFDKAPINPALLYGEETSRDVKLPRPASRDNTALLWKVNISTGRVEQMATGDIDLGQELLPPAFQWTDSGELLFHATRLSTRVSVGTTRKAEWLVLGRSGTVRPLSGSPGLNPERLQPIDGGARFVGLSDGELWRIEVSSGVATNLTKSLDRRVYGLRVFDRRGASGVLLKVGEPLEPVDRLYVRDGFGFWYATPGMSDYVLDPSTGVARELPVPSPEASMGVPLSDGLGALYKAETAAGAFVWRSVAGATPETVVASNAFLRDIRQAEERVIEFTSLNGESLRARLTLPVDYVPGRRYPLVVDSDIGYPVHGIRTKSPEMLQARWWDQLFASAGYAYLFTSMPSTSMDDAGRANLLLIVNSLIPAVEKAIASGVADPDRLFIYGISSFGYGTFGAVTQTSRFKAAVAQAGWTDQISYNLGVKGPLRYTDNPSGRVRFTPMYSSRNLPFWRNGDFDRRNSPLSYVDRVQTPLLIIHGEQDALSLATAEMFFNALVLQRKPARFVRYWGEGHGLRTPDNFRDGFQHVLSWYEEYGDILRDASGKMVFEGDRVQSRQGKPALTPTAFGKIEPAAPSPASYRASNPQ